MIKYLLLSLLLVLNSYAGFLPAGFEADFTQQTKTIRGVKEDPVKVFYKYRGNIYFDVKGSAPTLYICNNKKVWIYNPPFVEDEKGELKVGDSNRYCYSKFFDSLSNGLQDNKLYKVKKTDKKAELVFTKEAKDQLSIEKVIIEFNKAITDKTSILDVEKFSIYNVNKKDPVILSTKSIEPKNDLKDSKFEFIAPKNTNITEMQ